MATRPRIPATPYSPSTHPPIVLDKLEIGSLYLMISIPLPIYVGLKRHTYPKGVPSDPDYPHSTYEMSVSQGASTEEFHWDLYWHISDNPPAGRYSPGNENASADEGSGIIYRLRASLTRPLAYEYDRIPVVHVRTHAQLVGLVRVVSVPSTMIPNITDYLDWMLKASAAIATRSYVWASMAYYRTRVHLSTGNGVRDHSFNQFDISRFTAEVLSFAYKEVPCALDIDNRWCASVLRPRPIIAAWLGISLALFDDDDVTATRRKRDELLRRQREEVGVFKACWHP